MTDAKLLARHRVHAGKVLDLRVDRVEMPNGRISDLEVIHHGGAAAIVAVDDEGQVVLVRQYRYAVDDWLLEVPAGKLDDGEAPESCARRELTEETGYRPRELESLGWIYSTPGFSDEKIWLYLARGLEPARQALEDDEVLEVEWLPFAEAAERARDGRLRDGKSVCALLRAEARLEAG